MQVSKINNYSPSFKSIWTNKAVLKGLETISEHGTSFIAATSLVMASGIRPLLISKTPNTDEENKKYMAANSILSGLTKFLTVEAIALPIEHAIKNIDKAPEKYLAKKTIENLKNTGENIVQSGSYKFATQLLKLSTGFITAIPKSMLTIALLPVLLDKLNLVSKPTAKSVENGDYQSLDNTAKNNKNIIPKQEINKIFEPIQSKQPSFNGQLSDITAKGIGKIIDNSAFQNFVKKNTDKAPDIARNISMATDALLTLSFIHRTQKNKNIKEERKKPLIYNSLISTGFSIIGGYSIDKLIQKGTKNFINKFSELNKNDPKLPKYIEGINIVRPTLIFAGIYYGILPMISTYLADKTDKFISQSKENKSNPISHSTIDTSSPSEYSPFKDITLKFSR